MVKQQTQSDWTLHWT